MKGEDVGRAPSGQALVSDQVPAGLDPSGFDPSRVRSWLEAMTRQGEDQVWRGAEKALAYLDALEESLAPFAAYMNAMDAYAALHRGRHLPDNKVLAYSQTEMGTSGALVIGHFRDAQFCFGDAKLPGWGGLYRSKLRERDTHPKDGDSEAAPLESGAVAKPIAQPLSDPSHE